MSQLTHADILLVGTGVMGIGIAQVAILHAHRVFLYDKNQQATQKAYLKVIDYLHHLGSIGQMTSAEIKQFAENLIVVEELGALKGAVALVIEAVS
ncbi:MAG: 3-hydroxyacyl-CoA dehydrogenase NAD-binding domain-containing protein, partial [Gammaproteobacteria bacterium]|nr:3-hydroxyacyl-CoA dehydrogenase NAD-binding domain-containing protein [Gammaproteobacteria bacterium]